MEVSGHFTPRPLYPKGNSLVRIGYEAGWAPEPVVQVNNKANTVDDVMKCLKSIILTTETVVKFKRYVSK
jgi:hypothetical protein